MRIGRGRFIGSIFKWLDRATRSASVVAGAVLKVNTTTLPLLLAAPIKYLQQGLVVPTLLVAMPVIIWARHRTDRSRMEAVHGVLNQMCDQTFRKQQFELEQHRRVTLFQYKRFCWRRWPFLGGWLIPVERSGDQTRNTGAIFSAPDDGEDCEGVAGRAWSRQKTVYVPNLPDLRTSQADADFKTYAEQAFCATHLPGRSKPPQSRSLYGVPVKINSKRWGVIVVDSVLVDLPTGRFDLAFQLLAPTLDRLL
jgi:hypothetical protein